MYSEKKVWMMMKARRCSWLRRKRRTPSLDLLSLNFPGLRVGDRVGGDGRYGLSGCLLFAVLFWGGRNATDGRQTNLQQLYPLLRGQKFVAELFISSIHIGVPCVEGHG
jgi:hypothetical protein